MLTKIKRIPVAYLMYCSWIIALVGVVASVVYSEILGLAVCPLCWYQRIFWYPLALIFLIGILTNDKKCFYYALPLVVFGVLFSVFHMLLQAGVLPTALESCGISDVSCKTIDFKLFGFFTIPQQSFLGFLVLGVASVVGVLRRDSD
jgi:disulfide bond formation protein DsbB